MSVESWGWSAAASTAIHAGAAAALWAYGVSGGGSSARPELSAGYASVTVEWAPAAPPAERSPEPEVVVPLQRPPTIGMEARVEAPLASPDESPIEEARREELKLPSVPSGPAGVQAQLVDAERSLGAVPYPERCRRRGEEGDTVLSIEVGADGAVEGVSVASSSGFRLLDENAEKAVRLWRFRPATRDGAAVPSVERYVIRYRLRAE